MTRSWLVDHLGDRVPATGIDLVVRRHSRPTGLEDEVAREQQRDRTLNLVEQALASLAFEPPAGDALQRVLRFWMSFQITQHSSCDFASSVCFVFLCHVIASSASTPAEVAAISCKHDRCHRAEARNLLSFRINPATAGTDASGGGSSETRTFFGLS